VWYYDVCTSAAAAAAAAADAASGPAETASVTQIKPESLTSGSRQRVSSLNRTSYAPRQSKVLSTSQIPIPIAVAASPTSPEAPQTPPLPSSTQIVSYSHLLTLTVTVVRHQSWLAWVGDVCLFVYLFVCRITQKRMIPKYS